MAVVEEMLQFKRANSSPPNPFLTWFQALKGFWGGAAGVKMKVGIGPQRAVKCPHLTRRLLRRCVGSHFFLERSEFLLWLLLLMQTESLLVWLHLVGVLFFFSHRKQGKRKKKRKREREMSLIPLSRPLEFQSVPRAQGKLNEDTGHNSAQWFNYPGNTLHVLRQTSFSKSFFPLRPPLYRREQWISGRSCALSMRNEWKKKTHCCRVTVIISQRSGGFVCQSWNNLFTSAEAVAAARISTELKKTPTDEELAARFDDADDSEPSSSCGEATVWSSGGEKSLCLRSDCASDYLKTKSHDQHHITQLSASHQTVPCLLDLFIGFLLFFFFEEAFSLSAPYWYLLFISAVVLIMALFEEMRLTHHAVLGRHQKNIYI